MEITGKIIAVLPKQGGTSKMGNPWEKQEYVLETYDQYPKKICFQIFGSDRIEQANIQGNDELIVTIDIESREYQGRWYTNISARKVEHINTAAPAQQAGAITPDDVMPTAPSTPNFNASDPVDDLPF